MLRKTALLLAISLWPLPAALAAGDIRGDARTTAKLKITTTYTPSVFETESDLDWYKVQLKKGVDYAISGETQSGYGIKLRLRDAKGKLLRNADGSGDTDVGTEFRPKKSGTYFVEVGSLPDQQLKYNVRVAPDCRGDRTTKCQLKPGVVQKRATAFSFDEDWFKVQLTAGRSYRVDFLDEGLNSSAFVDAKGQRLAYGSEGFTPTRSGTYYVNVYATADNGSAYTVRLVSP